MTTEDLERLRNEACLDVEVDPERPPVATQLEVSDG